MPVEMLGKKTTLEKHGKSDANEAVLHELRLRHALLRQEKLSPQLSPLLAQQKIPSSSARRTSGLSK